MTKNGMGWRTKIREICKESFSGKPWPINAFPLPILYEILARRFEDAQQWKKALQACLKIVYIYRSITLSRATEPTSSGTFNSPLSVRRRIATSIGFQQDVSQISETKASFRTIEVALSVVRNQERSDPIFHFGQPI